MGYTLMYLNLGITLFGLVEAAYVAYIRLDSYHLLFKELNQPNIFDNIFIHILRFVLTMHEGQTLVLVMKSEAVPLMIQASVRTCLLYKM